VRGAASAHLRTTRGIASAQPPRASREADALINLEPDLAASADGFVEIAPIEALR
jgi:hypothetical protein